MQHEQSLADNFNSFMGRKAVEFGCRFHSFSLDGQDCDAGADYVLTDVDRFAIVEFKYSDKNLISEKHKPRRLKLCKGLAKNEKMRNLHDKCHFISWAEGKELSVKVNIYRKEVCNNMIFGNDCSLIVNSPEFDARIGTGKFADDFFRDGSRASLTRKQFEAYVAWVLMEMSGSQRSTLELIAFNPKSMDLALVRLESIEAAQNWVREHYSPPRQGIDYP
ncbi:hypothetical protein [Vreelandella sp.]|uniref:hypothetical protein n=1 Tax=Vreelandella sp. TaxID=3137778 RepID=UPI003BA99D3D